MVITVRTCCRGVRWVNTRGPVMIRDDYRKIIPTKYHSETASRPGFTEQLFISAFCLPDFRVKFVQGCWAGQGPRERAARWRGVTRLHSRSNSARSLRLLQAGLEVGGPRGRCRHHLARALDQASAEERREVADFCSSSQDGAPAASPDTTTAMRHPHYHHIPRLREGAANVAAAGRVAAGYRPGA